MYFWSRLTCNYLIIVPRAGICTYPLSHTHIYAYIYQGTAHTHTPL